jgi:hypothetical protein
MSLIVEDGTGLPTAESYAAVTDFTAYVAASLNPDPLVTAALGSTPTMETALKMATRVIDANMNWHGFRTTTAQALDWPRQRARNPDAYVYTAGIASALSGFFYNANQIPNALVKATCEEAMQLIVNSSRASDAGEKGIKHLSLGGGAIAIDFDKTDRIVPLTDEVFVMLYKLGTLRGAVGAVVRVRRG